MVHVLCFLQISTFNNELQGQSGPGFSWALFDGSSDAVTAPKSTSSKNFTFTDNDIRRVCMDSFLSHI